MSVENYCVRFDKEVTAAEGRNILMTDTKNPSTAKLILSVQTDTKNVEVEEGNIDTSSEEKNVKNEKANTNPEMAEKKYTFLVDLLTTMSLWQLFRLEGVLKGENLFLTFVKYAFKAPIYAMFHLRDKIVKSTDKAIQTNLLETEKKAEEKEKQRRVAMPYLDLIDYKKMQSSSTTSTSSIPPISSSPSTSLKNEKDGKE